MILKNNIGKSNQFEKIDPETTESNLISDKIENAYKDQIDEENLNETSVRRLSLFDSISKSTQSVTVDEKEKSEPVISTNTNEQDNDVIDDLSPENEERLEPEFSATDNESDEDFNQETEEELLDIPTFLRRQAN